MRSTLVSACVAALGALAPAAVAHAADGPAAPPPPPPLHDMDLPRIDANSDGFVSRDEARAMAETMFARLDTDGNGKLDASDRPRRGMMVQHMEERDGDRRIERDVRIERRGGGDDDRHEGKGRGAHRHGPPRGPMFAMLLMNNEEADRDGDGALSKSEFVAQQLRFFDAADANGDGKVKFEPPPRPPEMPDAPTPPAPPQSPRR